jgi:hypothetical protein
VLHARDRGLARFLNAVAEPDDVLAVTDIGQFGLRSDLVILDMAGLVDRTTARELARTRRDASAR